MEFCELIDASSWLITALYRNCGKIDFRCSTGEKEFR